MRSGVSYSKFLILSIITLLFVGNFANGSTYLVDNPTEIIKIKTVNKSDILLLDEPIDYHPFVFQNQLMVAIANSWNSQVDIINGSDNWSFAIFLNPLSEGRLVSVASSVNQVFFLSFFNFSFTIFSSSNFISWNSEAVDLNLSGSFSAIYAPNLFALSNGTKIIFFIGSSLDENIDYSLFYTVKNETSWFEPKEIITVSSVRYPSLKVIMVNDDKFIFSYYKKENEPDTVYGNSYLLIWENNVLIESIAPVQYVREILYLPNGKILFVYEQRLPVVESPVTIRFEYFNPTDDSSSNFAYFTCYEGYDNSCWDPEIILFNNALHLFFTKRPKYTLGQDWTGILTYMQVESLDDELNLPYPIIDVKYTHKKGEINVVLTVNKTKSENYMFENTELFYYEFLYSNLSSPNFYGTSTYGFLNSSYQIFELPSFHVSNNTASVLLNLVIVSNNHYWYLGFSFSFQKSYSWSDPLMIISYLFLGIQIVWSFYGSFKTRQDIKNQEWLDEWRRGNVGQLNLREIISKIKRLVVFFIFMIPVVIILFYFIREEIENLPDIAINISSWLLGAFLSYIGLIYAFKGFKYRNMLGERIKTVVYDSANKIESDTLDWEENNEIHIVNVGNTSVYIESVSLLVFSFRIPGLFTFDRRAHIRLKAIKPLARLVEEDMVPILEYKGFLLDVGSKKKIAKNTLRRNLKYLSDWNSQKNQIKFSKEKWFRFLLHKLNNSTIVMILRFLTKPFVRVLYGKISETYIGIGVLKYAHSEMVEHINERNKEDLYEKISCIFKISSLEKNKMLFNKED